MRKCFLFLLVAGLLSGAAYAQGKISGYMFGDYFYNVSRDTLFKKGNLANSAVQGQPWMQAFQLRRIYLTYDNDISEKFTTRFRLEADQVSKTMEPSGTTDTSSYNNGKIGVAVKDAWLRWKNIFSGSDLWFGIQPTTAYDISESAWGYRSLEKTIMDLRGIIPSRELGVALRGKFDDGGMFNYWAMIADGNGQRPGLDKYKRYSLTLHVKPMKELQFTLTGDYRDRADITDPNPPKGLVGNAVTTGALFAGYSVPDEYNFGVEGFLQSTQNGFNDKLISPNATKTKSALGFTVFGEVNLQKDLVAIVRYDYFDPNTDGDSKGDARNYIIGALNWKVDKNVWIMPNVQIETYEKAPSPSTLTYSASVNGRITLYYIFL